MYLIDVYFNHLIANRERQNKTILLPKAKKPLNFQTNSVTTQMKARDKYNDAVSVFH